MKHVRVWGEKKEERKGKWVDELSGEALCQASLAQLSLIAV